MKFYIVRIPCEGPVGCELLLRDAHRLGQSYGTYEIEMVEVDVNTEAVRRLLGEIGGYANSTRTIKGRENP